MMEKLLGLGGSSQKVEAEPAPTRDAAADAIAATKAEQDKRRSWDTNSGSNQLTPVGGVTTDMTSLRRLTSAG